MSIFWFANTLNLALTIVHAAIAFTPLYDVVFRDIIGLNAGVAALARPAFMILLPWTPAIGWRRYFQGILINHGWTTPIAWGTAVRVSSLGLVVVLGVLFTEFTGVIVAAAGMTVGVVAEASFTTTAFVILVSRQKSGWLEQGWARVFGWSFRPPTAVAAGRLDLSELLRFYTPLAVTSSIAIVGRPLISAALARSQHPELSLATWPVVWSTVFLFVGPLTMLQQLVIGYSQPAEQKRETGRFAVCLALVFAALLAAFSLSPASRWYLTTVVGVRGDVLELAISTLRLAGLLPLFYTGQHWFYGLLIRQRQTLAVNAGAVGNLVFLTTLVFAGALITQITGAYLAVGGLYAGLFAEVVLLRSFSTGRITPVLAPRTKSTAS